MNVEVPVDEEFDLAEYIGKYLAVKAKKEEFEASAKITIAKYDEALERGNIRLRAFLSATNQTSASTSSGSVIQSITIQPRVGDWAMLHKWIVENNRPDMLQKRVTATAINQFAEENSGDLPPGVSTEKVRTISVHKPKVKKSFDN